MRLPRLIALAMTKRDRLQLAQGNDGGVVFEIGFFAEALQFADQNINKVVQRFFAPVFDIFGQSLFAKHTAVEIFRLGDAVGVQHQHIAAV